MGVDDKKSKPDEGKQVREVSLTEEQEQLFGDTIATLEDLGHDIKQIGTPTREFALGLTKLEEAEMWFARGFDALGLVSDEDDEDDEPDEDEEE